MKPGNAELEDRKLIEQTLAGQKECFDVLVNRHQSSIRKRIRLMSGRPTDEDDLVQQVFLKAWSHLATFRYQASFRTWIIQIATNEVLQQYRRECRSPILPALADLDAYTSGCATPHQSFERAEAKQRIRCAIERLPAAYKQILVLCDLKELSAIETARQLQASIPLVKTRLFRARRMLSAALRRQNRRVARRLVTRNCQPSQAAVA